MLCKTCKDQSSILVWEDYQWKRVLCPDCQDEGNIKDKVLSMIKTKPCPYFKKYKGMYPSNCGCEACVTYYNLLHT